MTSQDLFWRSRIIPNLLADAIIVVVVLLAYWNASAEAATALDGRCGMHIGRLIRRDQAGSQYRYRTGPKTGGGASTCRGKVRVKIRGGDLDRVRL